MLLCSVQYFCAYHWGIYFLVFYYICEFALILLMEVKPRLLDSDYVVLQETRNAFYGILLCLVSHETCKHELPHKTKP